MAKDIPYDQKYYDPEIECMPRPELEALQLERLKDMVAYAYDNTVYYKRAFDEAGVKPGDIESLDDIAKFPFCDKKTERETQHVGSFFGEMCSVPEEEVIFMATSSGSTGVPTVSPFTQEDFDLWQDTEARLFWQAGMRPNDRYVHGLNFALYVGGPDVIGAQRLGALAIWVGAVPSDRLLFVLKQYQPTIIWTSPSYAWHLARSPRRRASTPRKTSTSTPSSWPARRVAPSSPRARPSRTSGARRWSTSTACPISTVPAPLRARRTTACTSWRTRSSWRRWIRRPAKCWLRVRRRAGVHDAVQEARPMIRFRTGDIGYVSTDTCECGRTLARIHVTGRKDEMFIVARQRVPQRHRVRGARSGRSHGRVLHPCVREELHLQVRSVRGALAGQRRAVRRGGKPHGAALKAHTGVRPAKVIVYDAGKLGTSSEHKASRFIDERGCVTR